MSNSAGRFRQTTAPASPHHQHAYHIPLSHFAAEPLPPVPVIAQNRRNRNTHAFRNPDQSPRIDDTACA
jgi:hypothetical protein